MNEFQWKSLISYQFKYFKEQDEMFEVKFQGLFYFLDDLFDVFLESIDLVLVIRG